MAKTIRIFAIHSHTITIAGALIVFITFIVKDAIREHLRDVVSSLELAETAFSIRNDDQVIIDNLNQISTEVEYLFDQSPGRAKYLKSRKEGKVDSFMSDVETITDEARAYLDNVSHLADKLSPQYKDLHNGTDSLRVRLNLIDSNLTHIKSDIKNDKNSDEEDFFVSIVDQGAASEQLMSDIIQFNRHLIEKFKIVKNDQENIYSIFTWCSYILFTIGWGLTLFGRILGIKGLETD